MRLFNQIVLGLACLASGAAAAELDGCNLTPEDYPELVAPMLDGAWEVHNGAGILLMKMGAQEMQMPMPPAGHETMVMLYRDGGVIADMALFGEAEVRVASADTEIALVPVDGAQRDMDFDKLGDAPNCTSDVMLRLEFDQERTETDGTYLWAHFHLAVLDENRMSGVLVIQGRGEDGAESHGRRLVTFLRRP